MSLLTRISVPAPPAPEAEDIFSSALTTIFTDDAINSWGSPGAHITYRSPRFGPLTLQIPVHPDEEQGRTLFAHYLWNAGVVAADAIEEASAGGQGEPTSIDQHDDDPERIVWDKRYWSVRGKRTLEIGAATALPSLIAALVDALSVTITDHPSSPALTNDAIVHNVRENLYLHPAFESIPPHNPQPRTAACESILVYGYTWGTSTFYQPAEYGKPASPPLASDLPPATSVTEKGYPRPDKIIVADCLWMPSQHVNILRTILHFLPQGISKDTDEMNSVPCALVVAGFHTGRAIVRNFFDLAVGHSMSSPHSDDIDEQRPQPQPYSHLTAEERACVGKLRLARIFEMDMDKRRRDWVWASERKGEGKWEAKRWCVVGVLVRR